MFNVMTTGGVEESTMCTVTHNQPIRVNFSADSVYVVDDNDKAMYITAIILYVERKLDLSMFLDLHAYLP